MIETIKSTLNANENITKEVKENLMELITLFHENFKDVDLTNLNERLGTLTIKPESAFLVKMPCKYVPFKNEIRVNVSKFAECDARHWLMHSVLGMVTAKDNYYGFNNENDSLLALNEGYTEMITRMLVGDVEGNLFTDEMIMATLYGKLLGENGNDILYSTYFGNNSQDLLKAVMATDERNVGLIDAINSNYEGVKHTKDSKLYDILREFVDINPHLIGSVMEQAPMNAEILSGCETIKPESYQACIISFRELKERSKTQESSKVRNAA